MDASLSERLLTEVGMSNSTQWVNVPLAASGSSMMRTKRPVFGGAWLQFSAGKVSVVSHVWLAGIGPPCRKAGQINVLPFLPYPDLLVCASLGSPNRIPRN
jgi:hypothetical protein